MSECKKTNVLIIGTGLAGLTCALELADSGVQVTLVTKTKAPQECNSNLAQGGVVYRSNDDSPERLASDINTAGNGVGYAPAIEQLSRLGPELVRSRLIEKYHVNFDVNGGEEFAKVREGAHSVARVIHVGDATGKAIETSCLNAALEHKNINLQCNTTVIDVLTIHHHSSDFQLQYGLNNYCCGAYLLNNNTNEVTTMLADYTVLATGGVGQLYLHSTNTAGSIGAGLAIAARAGADLLYPHYVQFHPTALWRGKERFLISEALRGSGAKLINRSGEAFMHRYNPELLELAPRDEVTRAILSEMMANDDDCVYLDLTAYQQSQSPIEERFPTIYNECLKYDIDIRKDKIPVVPAAHYLCGGIKVDLNGQTTLNRLFAVGEVACTGVHGANRLASTSLLECLTWGVQAGRAIFKQLERNEKIAGNIIKTIRNWHHAGKPQVIDQQRLAGDWSRIRTVMWNYVGIVRQQQLLEVAARDFRLLSENLTELYHNAGISAELVNLFHGVQSCRLIVESARRDQKSIGCHYLTDR